MKDATRRDDWRLVLDDHERVLLRSLAREGAALEAQVRDFCIRAYRASVTYYSAYDLLRQFGAGDEELEAFHRWSGWEPLLDVIGWLIEHTTGAGFDPGSFADWLDAEHKAALARVGEPAPWWLLERERAG